YSFVIASGGGVWVKKFPACACAWSRTSTSRRKARSSPQTLSIKAARSSGGSAMACARSSTSRSGDRCIMSYFGRIVSATPLGSSVLPVMEHAAKADLCPVYQYSDNWHRKGQLILMFAEHVLPILIF